jgi:hypothetical protein
MSTMALVVACGSAFTSTADGGAPDGSTVEGSVSEAGGEGGGGPGEGGGTVDGGGAKEGGALEAGAGEASPPVEAGVTGTYCGPQLRCTGDGGQQGTICCVENVTPPGYACAGLACACETQLACSDDTQCPGQKCCIDQRIDAVCATGHYVSHCSDVCVGTHMCNPAGPSTQCAQTQTCSGNGTAVDLPAGQGFGICQ